MRRTFYFLASLAALISVGCGSGKTPYAPAAFGGTVATPAPTAPPTLTDTFPDFNFTAPFVFPAPAFDPSGALTVNLTVRTNSAVGAPVTLTLKSPPDGVSATFSPASVTPSSTPTVVAMTIKASDPSKAGSVTVIGRSGTLERTASVNYSAYVAPSGFSIAVKPVAGQSDASRTRDFDVTLSQTAGSGPISLDVNRNDTSGGDVLIPSRLPEAATVTGLPSTVTLSGASQTFRLTVTLPRDTPSFFYGFGVTAARGGRTEKMATQFFFAGAASSPVDVSQQVTVVGNVDMVKLTYTPKSATFAGTIVVSRLPDGDLGVVPGSGILNPLPAGFVVAGLPQTLAFDGTGAPRTATFTVTAPSGTPSATYYGIRVGATQSGSDVTLESVLLLQFGFGGE